jgi:hypothetical protein
MVLLMVPGFYKIVPSFWDMSLDSVAIQGQMVEAEVSRGFKNSDHLPPLN